MNSAPNQPNNTFNSQPATGGQQTNPFTADLKGEFTSNFGTNTNAVSQIFKDGSFSSSNRTRYMIMGGVILLIAAVGWYVLNSDSDSDSGDDQTVAEDSKPANEAKPAPDTKAAEAAKPAEVAKPAEAAKPADAAPAASAISLTAPDNGASMAYDETQGPATFSWSGGPGTIVFSRHSGMQPEVMRVKVSGSTYAFHHPWPGQWFWKVETEGGASDVRSFNVSAPVRRNVALTAPASGATLAGTGGVVSWTGDKAVAYYRAELNQSDDWSNPQYKFSSSGSQVQLNGVGAGQYKLRLGAFSEVSGRWEYTQAVPVTIQ